MSKTQKMAFMTQDKIIKAQERGAETSENEKQQKEKAYASLRSKACEHPRGSLMR